MDQEEMEVCSGARRSEERGTCGEDVLYERKIYFQLEKKERKLLCAFTLQMHICLSVWYIVFVSSVVVTKYPGKCNLREKIFIQIMFYAIVSPS